MVLIDTSYWLEFFNPDGRGAYADTVAMYMKAGEAVICETVLIELQELAGTADTEVLGIIEATIPCLPVTDEVQAEVARLANIAVRSGKSIPRANALIFATAKAHGVELLHDDGYYEALALLSRSWVPE